MSVTLKERLGAGTHWRLLTQHGPVHVWVPDAGIGDGTVVYVHGFYDNADVAWDKFNLAGQFQLSGRQAAFIVPEAPVSSTETVQWQDLGQLLSAVAADTGVGLPEPVTVIGHSGAYRTILLWLGYPGLKHITLLDALYAGVASFLSWGMVAGHTLDIVVTPTGAPRTNADAAAPSISGLVTRTSLPLDPQALASKVLYLVAPMAHFDLVTPPTAVIAEFLRRAPTAGGGLGAIIAVGLAVLALWLARS